MLSSLRSRFLLSFALISGAILLVFGLVLFPLSLIPTQIALQENVGRLLRANRASQRLLQPSTLTEPTAVQTRLETLAADYDVRLLVLDEERHDGEANGRVVVRYDSEEQWTGNRFNPNDLPARQLAAIPPDLPLNARIERLRTPSGESWLILQQELRGPRRRFSIAFAVPEVSQIEAFRLFFFRPVVIALIVATVLAIVLALMLSRWITRPLQNLVAATDAIAAGDYSYRLEETSGPTEVKRVAGSFNAMAGRVEQTQQAQRDFVANVSHDLKTPLTSIQGWSQALLDGAAQTPAQRERAAGVIHTEAERMARQVNQLLDLARLESGQLGSEFIPVDLTAVVQNTLRGLRWHAQEKDITLKTVWPSTLEDHAPRQPHFICLGDPEKLQQALSNLVENALQYSQAGSEVTVSLAYDATIPHTAVISVRDQGAGIPPADLDRIWERFYQVDKARTSDSSGQRSIGLGLAIVRQLVERHGGQVSATSTVGEGSLFTIQLPLIADEA